MPNSRRCRVWLVITLFVCLHLGTASAHAQTLDESVQRMAEINVEIEEFRFLGNTGQIERDDRRARENALHAEAMSLRKGLQRFSRPEQRDASRRVSALTKARLALLRPQWIGEEQRIQAAQRKSDADALAAIPDGVERALPLQRRRAELAAQKDKGEISLEEFTAEDRKALAEILDIRKEYAGRDGRLGGQFDRQLARASVPIVTPREPKPEAPASPSVETVLVPPPPQRPPPTYTAPPQPTPRPAPGGAGFSWFFWVGGIGLVAFVLRKFLRRVPQGFKLSDIFGTARWAPMLTVQEDDDISVARGVFLGQSSAPPDDGDAPDRGLGIPVCTAPEGHTLIVAQTRTGKGTRVLVPTLLRYRESAVVIDPKGENTAITARTRRDQLGQQVHILNPWGELAGEYKIRGFTAATFNPLDLLDRNDPNCVALAQAFARAICPLAPDQRDKFWVQSASALLTAVLLWLTDQPGETKTLARAREITSLSKEEFRKTHLAAMATNKAFGGAIAELSRRFVDMPHETYGGILTELDTGMNFISDPLVKAATASSSFSMTDLTKGNTTLYMVFPMKYVDDKKPWLRLMLAAAIHPFRQLTARERAGHRCLVMIDELANLGRIDNLTTDLTTLAGYGLDMVLAIQNLEQLKKDYGDDGKATILSNCANKWFCNINELETAKYLSDVLGKKTVRTKSESENVNTGTRNSTQGRSTTYGETSRPLLMPDEIMALGKGVAIALQPGAYPRYLRPIDYWDLQSVFFFLQTIYPGLYWRPPLKFDQNPLSDGPKQGGGAGKDKKYQSSGKKASSRQKASSGGGDASKFSRPGGMSESEARAVLGVDEDATDEEIKAAYMNLIKKVHPDHGGSKFLAQQLNAAKEVLLGE